MSDTPELSRSTINQRIYRANMSDEQKARYAEGSKKYFSSLSREKKQSRYRRGREQKKQWREENVSTARLLWRHYYARQREKAGLPPLPTFEPGVAYFVLMGKEQKRVWWLAVGERCLIRVKKDGSVYERRKIHSYNYFQAGDYIQPRGKHKAPKRDPNHNKRTVKTCCYFSDEGAQCTETTTNSTVRCDAHVGVRVSLKWSPLSKKAKEDQKVVRKPKRKLEKVMPIPALEFLARTWNTTVEFLEAQVVKGIAEDDKAIAELEAEEARRAALREAREAETARKLQEAIEARAALNGAPKDARRRAKEAKEKERAQAKAQAKQKAPTEKPKRRKRRKPKSPEQAAQWAKERKKEHGVQRRARLRAEALEKRRARPVVPIKAEPGAFYHHWRWDVIGVAVSRTEIVTILPDNDIGTVPATSVFELAEGARSCEGHTGLSVGDVRRQWAMSPKEFDDLMKTYFPRTPRAPSDRPRGPGEGVERELFRMFMNVEGWG